MPVNVPLKLTALPPWNKQARNCISGAFAFTDNDNPLQIFSGGGLTYVGIPWNIQISSATLNKQIGNLRALQYSLACDLSGPIINPYLVIAVDTMVYLIQLNAPDAADNSLLTLSGIIPIYCSPTAQIVIGLVNFPNGDSFQMSVAFYDFELPPVFMASSLAT
jgi:hypothetical protein